jgi:GNAT superfamily N-acetyltransferase
VQPAGGRLLHAGRVRSPEVNKLAMNDVAFRRMTEADLPAADRLREIAGWNQTLDDWRRFVALEPDGCFLAVHGAEVIGTVTTTTYDRALAWIGMMLVHPDHRGRGIGSSLMRRALEYLGSRGIPCIRLDATPAGRPMYEKFGFVSEWSLTRHERPPTSETLLNETSTKVVRDLIESDWGGAGEIDTRCFGVPRERLLRKLQESCRRALVCEREGQVIGWGLLRAGIKADYLGPLEFANTDVLVPLAAALLRSAEKRSVFWDVPDDNEVAVAAAQQLGFHPVRPLTRMRLGSNVVANSPGFLHAIADPALG